MAEAEGEKAESVAAEAVACEVSVAMAAAEAGAEMVASDMAATAETAAAAKVGSGACRSRLSHGERALTESVSSARRLESEIWGTRDAFSGRLRDASHPPQPSASQVNSVHHSRHLGVGGGAAHSGCGERERKGAGSKVRRVLGRRPHRSVG